MTRLSRFCQRIRSAHPNDPTHSGEPIETTRLPRGLSSPLIAERLTSLRRKKNYGKKNNAQTKRQAVGKKTCRGDIHSGFVRPG